MSRTAEPCRMLEERASAPRSSVEVPFPSKTEAAGAEVYFSVGRCSLGSILVASSTRGLCAIFLGDDPKALLRELQRRFPKTRLVGRDPRSERLMTRVIGLVETPARSVDLPLDISGTPFQRRVWQALREIPPGVRVSYREIAQSIGAPKAARAVAAACAANPLAVAIPCHRVVGAGGNLSGYRWGVARKEELLRRETRRPSGDAGFGGGSGGHAGR